MNVFCLICGERIEGRQNKRRKYCNKCMDKYKSPIYKTYKKQQIERLKGK